MHYEGRDDACPICQRDYQNTERVLRVRCRHVFHAECYENWYRTQILNQRQPTCPICRGDGTVLATWGYVESPAGLHGEPPAGGKAPTAPPKTPPKAKAEGPDVYNIGDQEQQTFTCQPCGQFHLEAGCDFPTIYHSETRLLDGRPAVLIDPGSVGNLCGDDWASMVAKIAHSHGYNADYKKRDRPLNVRGVGNGSQRCTNDCFLPMAFRTKDGKKRVLGNFTTPCVQQSQLPGLMGLEALRKNKAVIDFGKMEMHFLGPADYELGHSMPPGTDTFELELAPSGHIVLPCGEFQTTSDMKRADYSLTLIKLNEINFTSKPVSDVIPMPPPMEPKIEQASSSSSSRL